MSTTIPYEVDDRDPIDEDEQNSSFHPFEDPVSLAVGAKGFATRYVLDECVERFEESKVWRFPETFDRFYWEPHRLLIDILPDFDATELAESRKAKRCTFKEEWCLENEWAYIALPESEMNDVQKLRARINVAVSPSTAAVPVSAVASGDEESEKRQPVRKRGTVSRPKAASA